MPHQSYRPASARRPFGFHRFWIAFGSLALLLGTGCSDSGDGGVTRPDAGTDSGNGARLDAAQPDGGVGDIGTGTSLDATAEKADAGTDTNADTGTDTSTDTENATDAPSADLLADEGGVMLDANNADALGLGMDADIPTDAPTTVADAAPDEPVALDTTPDVLSLPDLADGLVRTDARSAAGYLTVVAHPDDDIIFFNPDLETFMRQGIAASIVYVTSGDQSEQERGWRAREQGILDAEAAMAGLTSQCAARGEDPAAPCPWSCAAATYLNHDVWQCKLQAFTAIFLRLPDGQVGGFWGPPVEDSALDSLSPIAEAGGSPYTRQGLIDVLANIMAQLAPAQILAMDSSMAYNSTQGEGTFDHTDHMGAGFFALAAAQAYRGHTQFRIYRGYTAVTEPDNVSSSMFDEKQRLMNAYAPSGYPDCVTAYPAFCRHQISYSSITGTGAVKSGGQCLRHSGSAVNIAACSGDASETWSVSVDGRVLANSGQCLTATAADSPVTLAACSDALNSQRWTWFEPSNGQLRGYLGGCLTSTDTGAVVLTDCGPLPEGGVQPRQQWRAP